LLLAVLSLSHFVGCAEDKPGLTFDACAPLAIGSSPALTSVQAQGLTDALSMWNQAAGTALVSSSAMDPIAGAGDAAAAMARVPLTFQAAAPPFHGLYDNQAGQIFINEDLTVVAPLRITIAHEIGHAFGLVHVSPDVRPSLMNPGNTTVGITPDDVAALAAIWGTCPSPTASP
jgi:predicted Zn-dependent protease